jgi:hypothetical protein
MLGAVGLSLSLAGGATAADGLAADMPTPNAAASHEITLGEEEIADVSLATFYVFDKETTAPNWSGRRLAMGACGGGCGGCASCAGGGGCWTGTNYTASVFGTNKPGHTAQHKQVPKNP